MRGLWLTCALAPIVLAGYAYVVYPLILRVLALGRPAPTPGGEPASWPFITITVPAYNEARSIAVTIENLLSADYPADRREILVISDASTDETDAIVGRYANRGVRLLRLSVRGGKTAAENAAGTAARGEIIVNTDASVRVLPDAIKPLVRAFADPTVGVASGRDISVGDAALEGNQGESGYVGYEMTLRAWETRVGSIIGASGCFYGIRSVVHDTAFPDALSRDFASVLIARRHGYRSVSVDSARCIVPRTVSLDAEFRRKIRTMARGLSTLWYLRALLDPLRYGLFAFMLASHKLARWLVYAALPVAAIGLIALATTSRAAAVVLGAAVLGILLGWIGMRWKGSVPRPLAFAGFALASALAGVLAWRDALAGRRRPIWDPTRRPT
jgi:cellulose synthase/poly-beta-1,6-N-acetylglucosamine synthase-like glycosyltransferase